MLYLRDATGLLLKNYARIHFGDNIVATSIWDMNFFHFYVPIRRQILLAIILRSINPDSLITLSHLNVDIQKLPDIDARVKIFGLDTFTDRFRRGFVPEVYIVEDGNFIDGVEFLNELKLQGYHCSMEAITETLDRAFIAYGMTVNEILNNNTPIALENLAYTIGYAMIALYQHEKRRIPRKISDVINIMFESDERAYARILSRIIGLINKSDIAEYLHNIIKEGSFPIDKLKLVLYDDFGRELIIAPYIILRFLWRRIFRKELMTLENFLEELINALEDMPYANIELRGTEPIPILRIKGGITTKNIELK